MRPVRIGAVLAVIALGCVLTVAFVGGATAADTVTITFEDDEDSVDLIATDVDDETGIGAFEINVSYDQDDLSLEIDDSDRFTVQTSGHEDGERTTKTIVGYTGENDETPGTVTLAAVSGTLETTDETELEITSVETFADVDGDAVEYQTSSVTLEGSDEDDEEAGGPPPIGGDDDDEDEEEEDDLGEVDDDSDDVSDDDADDEDDMVDDTDDVADDTDDTTDDAVSDDDADDTDETVTGDETADDDDVVHSIPQPLFVPILALALVVGHRILRTKQ